MDVRITIYALIVVVAAAAMPAGGANATNKTQRPTDNSTTPSTDSVPLDSVSGEIAVPPAVLNPPADADATEQDSQDRAPVLHKPPEEPVGALTPYVNGGIGNDYQPSDMPGVAVGHVNPAADPNSANNPALSDIDKEDSGHLPTGNIEAGVRYHF